MGMLRAIASNIAKLGLVSFIQSTLGNIAKVIIGSLTNIFTNVFA